MDKQQENQVTVIQPERYEVREMTVEEAVARFTKIEQLAERILKEGEKEGTGDFGIFPGTKQKVLFKSGAEKLCTVFRLGAFYAVEKLQTFPDNDHVVYTVRCTLRNQANGLEVGSALGLCSTMESKYRYRTAGRICPQCGVMAITKGNPKFGGGWFCWDKKGGCKAKFDEGSREIESQEAGKIENPDIADVENTVLKMAEKRAHVAATLNALGISSLFTQDIGDTEPPEGEPQTPTPPPAAPLSEGGQGAGPSSKYDTVREFVAADLAKSKDLKELEGRWNRLQNRILQARGRGDLSEDQLNEVAALYEEAKTTFTGEAQQGLIE